MNIIVVSPFSEDLKYLQNEVDSIASKLENVTVVSGNVTEERLIEFFNRDYDGFWFAGHGNADGLVLSDGQVFQASELISYIKRSNVKWLVLNSCDSDELVGLLLMATKADVLTVSKEIEDRDAWRVSRLLISKLASGFDIREAVKDVLPGNLGRHRFYANEHRVMSVENSVIERKLDEIISRIGHTTERLSVLESRFDGLEKSMAQQKVDVYSIVTAGVFIAVMVSQLLHHYL